MICRRVVKCDSFKLQKPDQYLHSLQQQLIYRYPFFSGGLSSHLSQVINMYCAADLPQESSCSVGVFDEGAEVWYSIKNTFRFWKWFGNGAFAFWTKCFGFLVSTEYDHFKEMVAVSAFVFDSRHEGISEWSSYGNIKKRFPYWNTTIII